MSLAYSQFEKEAGIKWYSSERKLSEDSDVALFSCVLQYLESPFKIIKKFAIRNKYLIITRIPFIDDKEHVISRQTFPDKGDYQTKNTSWPSWFFNRDSFMKEINKIGNVIYQWKTPTEIIMFEGENIMLEGMLIKTNKKK
jgi:putative methyltransferase (TIGR04325 family)